MVNRFKLPVVEIVLCLFLFLILWLESEVFYNRFAPKFFMASLCALFVGAFWVRNEAWGLRTKNKLFLNLILVITFSFLISIFNHESGEFWVGFFRVLNWVALCFFLVVRALQIGVDNFVRDFTKYFFPVSVFLVTSLIAIQFTGKKSELAYMGNPSILSEVLMISGIQTLLFWNELKNRYLKTFSLSVILAHLALLFYFKARAPLLGLILSFVYFAYKNQFTSLKVRGPVRKLFAGLFVAGVIIFILGLKNSDSMRNRWGHWINTLYMIRDNPLGVGPGAYEYVFERYNNKFFPSTEISDLVRVANPHNVFLEFFAEIGILGGVAFLLLFFFLFKNLLLNKGISKVSLWILCHSIGIMSLAFFIYPQDNPFPYVFLAVVAAVLLANDVGTELQRKNIFKVPLVTITIFSMLHATLVLSSDYLLNQVNRDDPAVYPSAAYSLNKESHVATGLYVFALLEKSEYEKAKVLLDGFEKKFPKYSKVELLWGEYFERTGDVKLACKHFTTYNQIFLGKTSVSEKLLKLCP